MCVYVDVTIGALGLSIYERKPGLCVVLVGLKDGVLLLLQKFSAL